MNRPVKQFAFLTGFAVVCMAAGMALSFRWAGQPRDEKMPVLVAAKGPDSLPPIAEVAERLNPTVVAILDTSFVKNRTSGGDEQPFSEDFFNWFFGSQRPGARRPQEEEQRIQAGGSGVLISADVEILTNHHVIEGVKGGDTSIEVTISDGRKFKARLLGADKERDIALIKIPASHLPFAQMGDSDAIRVGEWVVAIGNPLGLDHTVTQGIISAKGRQISGPGLESFLQTDAAINRGNSGGPLLNLKGEIIGINTAIRTDGQNIGFAVPVNMVKQVLGDLRSGRPVSRGFLGVGTRDLDAEFQDSLGVQEGVVVSEVVPGGPGDKGGIQRLDVITAVDGARIRNGDQLVAAIASHRAGDQVQITLFREGRSRSIQAVLGDRLAMLKATSDDDGEDSAPPRNPQPGKTLNLVKSFGFAVAGLTPAVRHQLGIANDWNGVVVTYVAQRSAAADKGLRAGLVIVAVGTRSVEGLQDFSQELQRTTAPEERKPLLLLVLDPQNNAQATLAIPHR